MKPYPRLPLLALVALAATLTGCSSFNTAQLKGLNVSSFQWQETYPTIGFSVQAFGVKTDAAGNTSVDSIIVAGHNPFGGGGGSITGLVLPANQPAPVLTASGPVSATAGK